MSEELTLEKLRVKERLEAVEKHMKSGEENRKALMIGFKKLETSVTSLESTALQVAGILKIANGIKWVLTKIFIAICTAIAFPVLATVFRYFSEILAKHTGG